MAGNKNDTGKLRMDLIPYEAEEALAAVLTHGAKKYGDHNWRSGIQYHRIFGAMRRHLLAWAKGKKIDKDSNLPHIWLAFCELAFLVSYEKMIKMGILPAELDDMPKYEQQKKKIRNLGIKSIYCNECWSKIQVAKNFEVVAICKDCAKKSEDKS